MYDLIVIMPAYNEDSLINTINEWNTMLNSIDISYKICVYDDGSTNNSANFAQNKYQYDSNIKIIKKDNTGHGPTILQGYCDNLELCEWLFQVDSDNEMDSGSFIKLWNLKDNFDFIVGRRQSRIQSMSRRIVSMCSRTLVKLFTKHSIWDVNTPYRLMRTGAFKNIIPQIPKDTFAPNVAITGLAAMANLRSFEIPVSCVLPQSKIGTSMIKSWKLLGVACLSFAQTIEILSRAYISSTKLS